MCDRPSQQLNTMSVFSQRFQRQPIPLSLLCVCDLTVTAILLQNITCHYVQHRFLSTLCHSELTCLQKQKQKDHDALLDRLIGFFRAYITNIRLDICACAKTTNLWDIPIICNHNNYIHLTSTHFRHGTNNL